MVALAPAPAGTAQILLGGRINLSGLELSIHVWPNARGCLKLDGNLRINRYKLREVTESFQTYILASLNSCKRHPSMYMILTFSTGMKTLTLLGSKLERQPTRYKSNIPTRIASSTG